MMVVFALQKNPSRKLALRPGENFVWFKQAPKNLRVTRGGGSSKSEDGATGADHEGASVAVNTTISEARLSIDDVGGQMRPLMDAYLARLKVLKVPPSCCRRTGFFM